MINTSIRATSEDIELFSVSHSQPDHVGNANLFADATWIVDRDERDYMFGPEARASTQEFTAYERLETARTTLMEATATTMCSATAQ